MTSRHQITTEKGAVNKTQLLKDKECLEILREQRAEKAASEQRACETEAEIWADPAHNEVRSCQTALGADKESKQACEDSEDSDSPGDNNAESDKDEEEEVSHSKHAKCLNEFTLSSTVIPEKLRQKKVNRPISYSSPRPVCNLPIQQTLGRHPISWPGPDLDYTAEDSAEDHSQQSDTLPFNLMKKMKMKSRTPPAAVKMTSAEMREAKMWSQDPQEEIGLYKSDLIDDIIIEQWFHGRKSVGIAFGASFNPISLPTLALVLTAIEYVLNRWSSGQCVVKGDFSEEECGEMYSRHLAALDAWRKSSPVSGAALARRQQELYNAGRGGRVPCQCSHDRTGTEV
ncbi:hypothetical protein M422DRAFT_262699 [Sphaerobolus stellatus SS14]|uniref:DUF6532 domain-containing protein n=1 Tax=Sphaerobolus stellatus (strain SS14) TaxID=990650 RepID=A0A0C9VCQ3_SPHS4|nr:hypothetical protein M422DRAFT_262699 [Sphaerobolus stellatus SS14]